MNLEERARQLLSLEGKVAWLRSTLARRTVLKPLRP